MGAFRATACAVGVIVATAFSAAPSHAAEPGREAGGASDLALPEAPAVTVTIEPSPAAARRDAAAPDVTVPALPEVTVSVEPARTPHTAPAVAAEVSVPPVPEAPVTFTAADLMADALASRLADPKFQ